MKHYRILIIAWYASISHVSEFIRNLKIINPKAEISLLTSKSNLSEVPQDTIDDTAEIICSKYYSGKSKNKLITGFVNRLFFVRTFIRLSKKSYDIVNIHYPRPRLSFVLKWIKKLSNNIIISPWGSDVLRLDGEKNIKRLRKVYAIADYITVWREFQIGKQIIEKFKVDPDKMVKLTWGGEFFDFIRENSSGISTKDAKARFGISNRYVITCGYNSQRQQRHDAIVDSIYSIRNQLPENLTLLFPFTYGQTEWTVARYTEEIREKGKKLGLDVVIIEEHLDMPDLFKLRMATDIFVHVQTTDAGSRCVMEYVACNKKVVHGAWMKYSYLENYRPSCYFPVDCMEHLGECIVKAYNAKVAPLPQTVANIIMERGWNYKMKFWNDFFESLV